MKTQIDGIEFRLQKPHDFNWLGELGTVFAVYDEQDSGNLLFGVANNGAKYFVKYAGAQPQAYTGSPESAISRLSEAAEIYQALQHEHLIKYLYAKQCDHGLALIFEWFDGRGLHEHWTFAQCGKYAPNSPYRRYLDLPVDAKLKSVSAIFGFLQHAETCGYVAVDFYDGSIMYDFERAVTKICDIDFFRKKPVYNDLGEDFWGSTRFKAPEEYVKGAEISSATNVFVLGAMLCHFFGGQSGNEIKQMYQNGRFYTCPAEGWSLNNVALAVVQKATSLEQARRYQTIGEFQRAWLEALA